MGKELVYESLKALDDIVSICLEDPAMLGRRNYETVSNLINLSVETRRAVMDAKADENLPEYDQMLARLNTFDRVLWSNI